MAPDTCIARVPIFSGLTEEQQREVAGFARPVDARTGDQILAAGGRSKRLMVVHSGTARVVHALPNGHQRIVRTLGEGDVFGEDQFVLGRPARHFVYAESPARLCTFDHDDLARLVSRFPGIALRMLQVQSQRLSTAEAQLAAMDGVDVGSRLAGYLLDLPTRRVDGAVVVELPMAKKDVASYLGTQPETLSRRLREWSDAGVVELQGRRTIVLRDIDALVSHTD